MIGINRSLDKFSFDFILAVRKDYEKHVNYHENKQLIVNKFLSYSGDYPCMQQTYCNLTKTYSNL